MEASVNTEEEKRAMKTAMKIVVGTVVLAVALSLLSGLGDARNLKKVGLIVPGPIGDNGWSAAGYQALQKAAKKYGFQASHQENVSLPKAEAALRQYAEAGYDLVYAHMFVYSAAAARVAKAFPKTKSVVIHGTVRNKTNLVSYQTMTQGGGFMAGALAALVSKTGKIGALGGRPIPPIADAIAGYVAVAKHVRPGVKVVDIAFQVIGGIDQDPTNGCQLRPIRQFHINISLEPVLDLGELVGRMQPKSRLVLNKGDPIDSVAQFAEQALFGLRCWRGFRKRIALGQRPLKLFTCSCPSRGCVCGMGGEGSGRRGWGQHRSRIGRTVSGQRSGRRTAKEDVGLCFFGL